MRIKKRAYAKVNLALDVLGRRENGYHDVKMVMQNLDIYDELEFELEDMTEKDIEAATSIEGMQVIAESSENFEETPRYIINIETENPAIPTDERNLIYKAAKLLFEEFNLSKKLTVKLVKNIPVEAGMAGGSTDAAATLHAVNELAGLGLSTKQLMEYGVRLGADVPFCVLAKTALSEGIGEVLTEIPALPDCVIAVAKPPVGVSTKLVYEALDSKADVNHPDVDAMVDVLRTRITDAEDDTETEANKDISKSVVGRVAALMGNVLEEVTIPMHPEIAGIKEIMMKNGAVNAMMTGSGPTVFGIYEDEACARAAVKKIEAEGLAKQIYITRPV